MCSSFNIKDFFLKLFCPQIMLKKDEILGDLPANEEVFQTTISMAWPSILESFLVALVGAVDTIMVGGLGSYAIAALGLTTQPKFICLAFFLSLSIGLSAVVARRKGERNREGANSALVHALMIAAIAMVVIITPSYIFANEIIALTGSAADTHDPAVTYFRIIVLGLVFNIVSIIINAAQRGVGNTKIAMRTNMASNLVNVFLNYLLIHGNLGFPALGIRGAAIATVIGAFVGFVMSVRSVLHEDSFIHLSFDPSIWKFHKETTSSIMKVSTGTLAEQLFMRIGFLTYTMVVANLGTNAFAAHQIGMNLLSLSFSLGDGLAVAAVALVGKSLGEKRVDLAKVYGSACQRIGIIFSVLVFVTYRSLGQITFLLYTDEMEVLKYTDMLIYSISLIVFMQIAQVVFTGALRGAGDTKYTAFIGFVSITIIRPTLGYIFVYPLALGLTGAWLGIAVDQFVRFILSYFRFKSGKWSNIVL